MCKKGIVKEAKKNEFCFHSGLFKNYMFFFPTIGLIMFSPHRANIVQRLKPKKKIPYIFKN